jgi:hypothetical protein
MKEDLNEQ